MSFLLDYVPIVLFAIAFKFSDIYIATAVLMGATVVCTLWLYAIHRKLTGMQKTVLIMVLGFGAITLFLRDEEFIKWKPSALYALSALAFAFMTWVKKKNLIKMGLADKMELPEHVWRNLNLSWILFFVFMAALNAYVVLNYSTSQWVTFKLWSIGLSFLLVGGQMAYAVRYLPDDPPEDAPQEEPKA